LLCIAAVAAALAAADKEAKTAAEPKSAEAGKTPFGVFKGAAKTPPEPAREEGSRKTPFGVFKNGAESKRGAEPEKDAAAPAAASGIRVVSESGEMVTFERKSPFGPSRWQRKKTELNADERAAWERSKSVRE
jgi:hypothetical protein